MSVLVVLGVCCLGALGFVLAGLRKLVIAAGVFERSLTVFEDRPVVAQFAALDGRFEKISSDVSEFPLLLTRARVALENIQRSRAGFQTAAKGVNFAARMARAVWDGPKRG